MEGHSLNNVAIQSSLHLFCDPGCPIFYPYLDFRTYEADCSREEIYVTSSSVIELDCPSPSPGTQTDGSDSGIYNASTDTGRQQEAKHSLWHWTEYKIPTFIETRPEVAKHNASVVYNKSNLCKCHWCNMYTSENCIIGASPEISYTIYLCIM